MDSKFEACLIKMNSGKSPELVGIYEKYRTLILSVSEEIIEEVKWGMPHYGHKGLMIGIGIFNKHVSIWFHKGTLMKDRHQLFLNGEGNKEMRQIQVKIGDQMEDHHFINYVSEAYKINEKGLSVPKKAARKKASKDVIFDTSVDFDSALSENSSAKSFYDSLTLSQQRKFQEYVTEAKQESTRNKRIIRAIDRLENGLKTTY